MTEREIPQLGAAPLADSGEPSDPLLAQAEARVASTLHGKWRLDVLLGVGGTAAVYAATHRNGSRVAVKILHPEVSTNPFVRDRFLWEGYVSNAVAHDGAVRVIDDDVAEDGSLFLVTELLDGETLEERRTRLGGRLPQSEVLLAADQLLDVLAAAHAKGIVHRDLKPENVFLTRAGKIKVLDFGIARLLEVQPASGPVGSGVMIGTPAYMPPEHAQGFFDDLDELSDLWACGAMMFRLLSGHGVHDGATVHEEFANAMTTPARPLATVAPEVDAAVARVVDRAVAFAKDMRWPDAHRMQAAVRQAYEESSGAPIGSAPALRVEATVPDRTQPRSRTAAIPIAWVPSSIGAVAISRNDARRRWFVPDQLKKGAVLGAAALGVALIGLAWVVGRASAPARVSSGTVRTVACAQRDPAVVELSPLCTPEVLATEPIASASRPAPQPAAARTVAWLPRWASRPAAFAAVPAPASAQTASVSAAESASPPSTPSLSSTAPSPPPDCQPPYFVDPATGKHNWKLECL
jgi:eukaryotic-like serine/threonine-protein kinase